MKKLQQFLNEDGAPANSAGAGNVAGVRPGEDPVVYPDAAKRYKDKTGDTFAGAKVFEVDMDTLMKVGNGKHPSHRYDRYLSDRVKKSGRAEEIRQYGRKNSRQNIALKDSATGAMVFLRRPKARISESLMLLEAISTDDLDRVIQQVSSLDSVLSVINEHYSGSKFPKLGEIQRVTHEAILRRLKSTLAEFIKLHKEASK
jgi:hypothetical protein